MQGAFTRTRPVSFRLASVRMGRPIRRTCHWSGSGSQRAKSASVREKGIFSSPSLRLTRGGGGFNVGEAWGWAGLFLRGGCCGYVRGLHEHGVEVPAAGGVAHEVTEGPEPFSSVVKRMVENSTGRRQRELGRMIASTRLARIVGSEPKAGSSLTTTLRSSRLGMAADEA